jgi:hypothetical protein
MTSRGGKIMVAAAIGKIEETNSSRSCFEVVVQRVISLWDRLWQKGELMGL